MVVLGVVVDALHVLDARELLVEERLLRRDLAAREAAQAGRQRPDQLRCRPAGGTAPKLSWSSLRSSRMPFLRMMFVNASSWRRPLFWSLISKSRVARAAQAHDLVHRRDALRAHLDAAEAVRAVVDAVRVLRQVAQPLLGLGVARVADEAVGLRQRGRPDEERVHLQRQAVGHAGAAVDAGHRLRDVDHRLRRHDVLALGRVALRQQPGHDPLDLLPVDRVHVHDQVLQHRHVAHRLDDDRAVVAPSLRVAAASCCRPASPGR